MHISISIGFEIDNTYVFDHCPKYKRMRNRALELFQEPYKNRNKNTPKRKTWAHNIKLFHKIMNQNKSKDSKPTAHEHENRAAERLAQALESPLGAQKLGDEAYALVKQELPRKAVYS